MIVLEAKLQGTDGQYRALDEALRTARFVRNSCLRYWMDNQGLNKYDLNKYCAVLAREFEWADKLNSIGLHKLVLKERGLELPASLITAKNKSLEKRGSPDSKSTNRTRASSTRHLAGSYQRIGEKSLSRSGFNAGTFRMWGTRDLHYYQVEHPFASTCCASCRWVLHAILY